MNRNILLLCIILLAGIGLANAQALVASYPFNANTLDASGTGNHGTINGNVTLTQDRFGNYNSAYFFNGTINDFIQVPNHTSLQLSNSYTLAAWVRPNTFNTASNQANFIVTKGTQPSEGHYRLAYGDFLDANSGVLSPQFMNFETTVRKGATEQSAYENPVVYPVQPGVWYYLVATFDGTTLRLYVNGVQQAATVITGTFGVLNTGNLLIGKSPDNIYPVRGAIDDIKIYNGPLTATQIWDEFKASNPLPVGGKPVAAYQFNGNTSDASVYANSGTRVGPVLPSFTTDCGAVANQSLSFPGNPAGNVASGVDVPHNAILNAAGYFRIESSFTINQMPGLNPANASLCMAGQILGKGIDTDNGFYGLAISSEVQPAGCDPVTANRGKLSFSMKFADGTTRLIRSTNALTIATCYNVVAEYDGAVMKLYLNNVLQGTAVVNKKTGVNTNKLTFGYMNNLPNAGNWFNGKIDDLKIYNYPTAPGSGKALEIKTTGSITTTPYVNLGTGFDFGAQPFTFETWIKRDVIAGTNNNFGKAFILSDNNNGWGAGIVNDNRIFFTKVQVNSVASTATIADTLWHHVAIVYTGTKIQFYVDGIFSNEVNYTSTFNSGGNYLIGPRQSFGNSNGDQAIEGKHDEIRVWQNIALDSVTIRNWMCKKILPDHPNYSNLFAYYRFDEGSGNLLGDLKGSHTGTIINGANWVPSGAAIGDSSVYSYNNPAAISFTKGSAGARVSDYTGGLRGMNLYYVDERHNFVTRDSVMGPIDSLFYFGVFPAGGTAPTYKYAQRKSSAALATCGISDSIPELAVRLNSAGLVWKDGRSFANTTLDSLFAFTASGSNEFTPSAKKVNKGPGSANALLFNGTSQLVDIGKGLDPTGSFSFETWVKRTSLTPNDPNSQSFIVSFNNGGWGVGINQSVPADRIYLSKIGVSQVVSASSITDTKWHHIAVTFNATTNEAVFYIDGVADAPVPYNPAGFNSNNSNYRLGGKANGASLNYLNGSLDEIRVWNTVLTQSQIRDWMTKKITTAHPGYANLINWYSFDETTGTFLHDKAGGNNGLLVNAPTWISSGAPLGDASAHDYVNGTKTATIAHPQGESFTATSTSGSPAGLQVYRCDCDPNNKNGIFVAGSISRYFGVFQAGGTSPQYTATYNYNGTPFLYGSFDETNLRLYKRADNAAPAWSQLANLPNTGTKTITATGESTEYYLSSTVGLLGCPGLPLSISSNVTGTTYQWQVNTGSGFANLSNGGIYSGVTTATLLFTNLPTTHFKYLYRCIVTGPNATSLEFSPKFIATWNGTASTAWTNAANWQCGLLPDINTEVWIRNGAFQPALNTNASARKVTVAAGATITLPAGVSLTVNGN
ncbi:MAG: LamG domain-containing protein [Bacteroidota bacterium]